MSWQDVAPMLRDSSARPFIPYNFLRDLDPECLQRLDGILARHLDIDDRRAVNRSRRADGLAVCRYEGCQELCDNSHARGQHERRVHGKAKSNGS